MIAPVAWLMETVSQSGDVSRGASSPLINRDNSRRDVLASDGAARAFLTAVVEASHS